jgi:hypothetical protein
MHHNQIKQSVFVFGPIGVVVERLNRAHSATKDATDETDQKSWSKYKHA